MAAGKIVDAVDRVNMGDVLSRCGNKVQRRLIVGDKLRWVEIEGQRSYRQRRHELNQPVQRGRGRLEGNLDTQTVAMRREARERINQCGPLAAGRIRSQTPKIANENPRIEL